MLNWVWCKVVAPLLRHVIGEMYITPSELKGHDHVHCCRNRGEPGASAPLNFGTLKCLCTYDMHKHDEQLGLPCFRQKGAHLHTLPLPVTLA